MNLNTCIYFTPIFCINLCKIDFFLLICLIKFTIKPHVFGAFLYHDSFKLQINFTNGSTFNHSS